MALTTDEQAMRSALQELTGGQPDVPVDRVDGIHRRYVRRRTAQSIGAALGVAALVAGGLSIASALRPDHGPSTVASSPALPWQLSWPERSDGTVDKQRVLFWLGQQGFDNVRNVRWLYAATAPGTIDKWAVLEATYASDPVPANALLAVVSHDGGDHWTAQTHETPPVSSPVLGFADQQGHAVLALLAPGVDAAELVNVQRTDGIDMDTFPPAVNGATVLTSATAWKPGSALVRVPNAPSTMLVMFDNDQQAVGQPAWWGTPPERQHRDLPIGSSFGGGGGGFGNLHSPGIGTLVLPVRCVGPVPMRLALTTGSEQDVNVDRCDGLFHTFLGPHVITGQKIDVYNHGDQGQNTAVIDVSVRP